MTKKRTHIDICCPLHNYEVAHGELVEIVYQEQFTKNTGFVKSAHKHVHFFLGLIFNILFSIFEMNMQ